MKRTCCTGTRAHVGPILCARPRARCVFLVHGGVARRRRAPSCSGDGLKKTSRTAVKVYKTDFSISTTTDAALSFGSAADSSIPKFEEGCPQGFPHREEVLPIEHVLIPGSGIIGKGAGVAAVL